MKTILLVSSQLDSGTIQPVITSLKRMRHQVIYYQSDSVFTGRHTFTVDLRNKKELVTYNDQTIDLTTIDAAWYRRPNTMGVQPKHMDRATFMALEREIRILQNAIWTLIPETAWINTPSRIESASNKLMQLQLARQCGFQVPETVISSDWHEIIKALPHKEIVIKMPFGLLQQEGKYKALYTTILDAKAIEKIRHTRPFPAIFQSYIPKKKEWRVTIIGDDVFAAAIYTQPHAKDDWRKSSLDPNSVRFVKEDFDPRTIRQCKMFLKELGLKFGAFDFIEDPDGNIFFLELNPNGQFGWLEDELGLPMFESVARLLDSIARRRTV